MIKEIVRQIVPPCLFFIIRKLKKKIHPSPFYGVQGDFSSWQDALNYCAKSQHNEGYSANIILDKVASAIKEVREGRAEFERDSFLFYKKDYNYQFLSALFLAFSGLNEGKSIHVVDFGGSLGSTFFQNRSLLSNITNSIVWNVIEQKHFVDRGRKEVPEINFYYDIEEYLKNVGKCDVLLFSAVLDYLPDADAILNQLLEHPWKFVLIDRSFYHPEDREVIAVQTVPPSIYDAQYPLHLRSIAKQESFFHDKGYSQILSWNSCFSLPLQTKSGNCINVPLKGFLYKKL